MPAPHACPTCGQPLPADSTVETTGEYPALVLQSLAASSITPAAVKGAGACSWCGKRQGAVRKLLGGPGVSICDECVALCADVLRAELPGWPK